jgi:ubiquinone/menaquinone biosynthesis C-methylase UbiE
MSTSTAPGKRPDYGVDAPVVLRRLFAIGATGLILGTASVFAIKLAGVKWLRLVLPTLFGSGVGFTVTASVSLWASKIGKLRFRDKIIQSIAWRGDEQVLDVGCGHGLFLLAAAKELARGKAIGVDLWQKEDQAGNCREATWQNAILEGVTDRVELKDGDARQLPFADGSFDVILSSWALHNIYNKAERDQAVRQIVRVLKPGGRLVLIDIRHTRQYARVLRASQMQDVKRSLPNFLFVTPTFVLRATKPLKVTVSDS